MDFLVTVEEQYYNSGHLIILLLSDISELTHQNITDQSCKNPGVRKGIMHATVELSY